MSLPPKLPSPLHQEEIILPKLIKTALCIMNCDLRFGGKNECHSIQDSVIKIRPSPKTLLIQ
jgi:hypothetical protein